MRTVNLHEAKTHLSRLVDQAAKTGEPFVIARAGKPLVQVVALDAPEQPKQKRLGFLNGQFEAPEDFNTMFAKEIEEMFHGE